jgi:eukaryotic-like serine/threonine-protein kinase
MKITSKIATSVLYVLSIALPFCLVESMPASMAQINSEDEMSESLIYDNPNLGFTLEYPSDWMKEESLSFISPRLSISDKAPESIAVTTEPNLSNLTLEEYSDSSLSVLESQFSNYTLIESSNSTLSGYPAHQILYTYTLEDVDLKNLQIWTIADDIVYVLTYGGTTKEFEDSLPVIQNMIDSFEITEIQ